MKVFKNFWFKNILTLIIVSLSFTLGFLVRDRGYLDQFSTSPKTIVKIDRNLPASEADLDFSLFWNIWDTIDTSYFDKTKLDDEARVYGAIKGMVSAIGDPYTVFLTPPENKVTQEDLKGNFGGVGIQIGFKGTNLAVIAPLKDSPAERAGIKAGDLIAGIKDEAKEIERGTQGITLPEAVQTIRGEIGSKITLSLIREGENAPIIVDVVRDTIDVPSIVHSFVGENESIAYIQVLKFGGETKFEWDEAVLEALKKDDLDGVIVDVRNNPGGYLQGAIDLGNEFLDVGEVVVVEESGNGERHEFKTENIGRLTRDKVVILVNGGSASASEIMAGALRDNIGAPIIGETTFGKGTIQEPKQLAGGMGLHITIARWLTPSGYWVHDQGLVPDIEVEDDIETEEDEQLEAAIEYFSGNSQTAAR